MVLDMNHSFPFRASTSWAPLRRALAPRLLRVSLLLTTAGLALGCAPDTSGAFDASAPSVDVGLSVDASLSSDAGPGAGLCANVTFHAEAQQVPAAMLIVLDRTASMSLQSKWAAAQQAIVLAIDDD